LTLEKEEKEHVDKLEQWITVVYDHILDSTQAPNRSAEEKIKIISQTIEGYRQEIEEIKEKLNHTTPPEVR
jgi:predicted  nucleic acid-binding Zn-ribbon protein